ncbi:MAG TPA: DUF808 domain-containing protein [Methylothermaceae bacterium]|nr:DUF808 domain-containing protein [Methylothermaceae bacterium]
MAGASLLALLDDIATLLDDISLMTKVAAKKTAGVLGDDLALNAEQVAGIRAEREIPVVWAVFKGSLVNKLILVPIALVISVVAPWLIMPLLMIGGAFLCYEGFEKVLHSVWHRDEAQDSHREMLLALADPQMDLLAFEREKIRGAIRTDFILSAEIIVIALGTVRDQPFAVQAGVVSVIALIITIGVYGLVMGIVKLDDIGLALMRNPSPTWWGKWLCRLGGMLVTLAPKLLKALSFLGTLAMFLVGGSILVHGLPWLHHAIENLQAQLGSFLAAVVPILANLLVGVVAGAVVLAGVTLVEKVRRQGAAEAD